MSQNTELSLVNQPQTATPSRSSQGQRSLTHWKEESSKISQVPPSAPAVDSPASQTRTAPQPSRPQAKQLVDKDKARRTVMPLKFMHLETSVPLSAVDDNPVFGVEAAAAILGVSVELMKKWRQRGKGPDYIQYEGNGPVRYTLSALINFRTIHTVPAQVKK